MTTRLCSIILLLLLFPNIPYLQTKPSIAPPDLSFHYYKQNKKTTIEINEKALFDIHLAGSLNNGLRIGSRIFFLKYYSLELSYGFNAEVIGGGEGGQVFGIGINLYPLKKYSVAFNLSGYYNPRYHYNFYYIISPNFGFLTSRDKGFHLHVLMGLSIIIFKFEDSKFTSTELKPNVELGFGIGF